MPNQAILFLIKLIKSKAKIKNKSNILKLKIKNKLKSKSRMFKILMNNFNKQAVIIQSKEIK